MRTTHDSYRETTITRITIAHYKHRNFTAQSYTRIIIIVLSISFTDDIVIIMNCVCVEYVRDHRRDIGTRRVPKIIITARDWEAAASAVRVLATDMTHQSIFNIFNGMRYTRAQDYIFPDDKTDSTIILLV